AEKTTQETEKSQTSNWSTRPYLPEARIPAGSPPPAPRTAGGLAGTADSATATATTVSSPPRSQVTSPSRPSPPETPTPAGSPPTALRSFMVRFCDTSRNRTMCVTKSDRKRHGPLLRLHLGVVQHAEGWSSARTQQVGP